MAQLERFCRPAVARPASEPADLCEFEAQLDRGRAIYFHRVGKLILSCAQCHDERGEAWSEQEMVDLELYLVQRAAGMKIDAPAVRP